jgi:mycothiol synthase
MTISSPALPPVDVPGAPAIPGLVFRRLAGPDDYPAIVEVMNAAYRADGVEEVVTIGQLAAEIEHPSHFDPARDVLVAEVDGRMVAHSRTTWADRADGTWTYDTRGHVAPEYRRRGLGRAILRWNERHHRDEVAPAHGGAGPRFLNSWAREGEAGAHALLRSEGYAPERYFFEMVRPSLDDVPDASFPADLDVRPVRETELRTILAAENEAFRDHWGHREATAQDWDAYLATPETDATLWVVVWDGDEVAGVALNVIWASDNALFGRQRLWIESLSVRRRWRRRGLARALLAASFRLARGRGMTSAGLGVDAANPTGALGLYEQVGFVVEKRSIVYRKPLE